MNPVLRTALLTTGLVAACGTTRSADQYRTDTAAVIASRNGDVKRCYDEVLKNNATAAGTVVVKFKVKAGTGTITDAAVDSAASNAPDSLSKCVVDSLNGLAIDPPDKKTGDATFSWSFKPGS